MTTPETTEPADRPLILTVDDDPSVSRAVARDLRRKYGEAYRIVRAESGADALEVLREIKLRGGRVAVLLADYRMPEMSGIEFLEAAMDLFPRARRALLTAYADTDAAIAAINVVDVDHYLLKPWDPPEEKLYPVLDAMLESYAREPDAATTEVKVVGHRWSAPSYSAREFLARNAVPYRWFTADSAEGVRLLDAAGADPDHLPVVVTPEGVALIEPTFPELAAAVGLSTTPVEEFYDLVVIGGGPAGLGSAVYGSSEGLRTLLIEKKATGGQAGQSSRIENYLGFPDGVSGGQLADRARRQAVKFGTEILTARDVAGLKVRGSALSVCLGDGAEVGAHTVIVATGVYYRELDCPGAKDLTGRGVYYGSSATEAPNCADQDVYIVGGANSAGQAAVYLAGTAKSVTLLIRGTGLQASMSHYLIEQLDAIENVSVRCCTVVDQAHGEEHLEALTLRHTPTGTTELVEASHCFVFIGAQPRTDWLDGMVARDRHGFILTGPDLMVDGRRPAGWVLERDPWLLESSMPGVFVAGDVRSESVKRVASAVGEGAMAVTLAHRFLASS
ncbi:MAG TPA: FAD-dependent oxidoreductase [Sporichthyaceae bacterium]